MIFTTKNKELAIFGNTIDDIRNKIDKFNEIKPQNGLFGENGAFASLFSGKKANTILPPEVLKQFDEFKEKFNSSSLSAEALAEQMENVDESIINYAKTCKNGEMTTEGFKASINGMSISAKAGKVALQALAMAGNMLLFWGISEAITLIHDCATASDRLKESASNLGNQFSSTRSDIEGYKSKINGLYNTINDSSSSYEDTYNARQELLTIQDEMIEKFGKEAEAVQLVTTAINGQTEALDSLTKQKWQETVNEFINGSDKKWTERIGDSWANLWSGSSNNFERMIKEMEDTEVSFRVIPRYDEDGAYEEFSKKLKEVFDAEITHTERDDVFTLSGDLDDIYNQLLNIQSLATNLGIDDSFLPDLSRQANAVKNTLESYQEIYSQHILYDKIFGSDVYEQSFKDITDAYKKYQDAFATGDEKAIEKAKQSFAEIVQGATDGVTDDSVVDFFTSMYPDLQSVVNGWLFEVKFKAAIEDNEDNLENDIKDAISKFGTSEEILNFNYKTATDEQKTAYETLQSILEDNNMELDELIAKLEKLGLISSDAKKYLRDKLSNGGQDLVVDDWIDTLTEEETKLANSTAFDEALEHQKEKLNDAALSAENYRIALEEVKAQQNEIGTDENPTSLSISDTISQLNTQLKPAFDSLKSAYHDIFTDDGGFELNSIDILSTCDSIKSKLDDMAKLGLNVDYSSYEDFVRVLSDSESESSDVETAFDSLAASITQAALSGAEDFETMKAALEDLGVVNSKMVAFDALASNAEMLEQALAQANVSMDAFIVNTEDGSVEATEAGKAFLEEKVGAENCAEALNILAFHKELCNLQNMNTADEVANLRTLAENAGYTGEVIQYLIELEQIYQEVASGTLGPVQIAGKIGRAAILQKLIRDAASNINYEPDVDFSGTAKAASSAGSSAGASYVDAFEEELKDLQTLRDQGTITEKEYLDQLRRLYQQFFRDKQKYAEEYAKYEHEYLQGMKSLYESALSGITSLLDKQINSYEDSKSAAVDSLEAERDARIEVIEAQKEQLEKQIDLIDKQIEAKEKIIDGINDEIDAMKEANQQRKRENDLAKAKYELERMQNQRTILQYSEEKGLHYVQDLSGMRDAKQAVEDAELEIEIAEKEKQIKLIEKEIKLLEERKGSINDQVDLLDTQIDEINKMYDKLISETESYWDNLISGMEDYKSRWEELAEIEENAKLISTLRQLGIEEDDILGMSEEAFANFKNEYLGILADIYSGNDSMLSALSAATGLNVEQMGSYLEATQQYLDSLGGKGEVQNPLAEAIGNVDRNIGNLSSTALDANSKIGETVDKTDNIATNIGNIADELNQIPDSQNITSLADAFSALALSISAVAQALGISEDAEISSLTQAISDLNSIQLDESITEPFTKLKTAVNSVISAICGGGEGPSGGEASDSSSLSMSYGADDGKGSGNSGGTSLTKAIEQIKTTADEIIGQPEAEGDETVIGEFGALETAVDNVTAAIGSDDTEAGAPKEEKASGDEGEGTLIDSIKDLGTATTRIMGEPGGTGVIGRFEQFEQPIQEADEHIGGILQGLENIDGTTVECTIKINVDGDGLPTVVTGRMDDAKLDSDEYTAQYGKKSDTITDTFIERINSAGNAAISTASRTANIIPLQHGDQMYDLLQKWNNYIGDIDNKMNKLVPSSMYEHSGQMQNVASQITNSSLTNKNQPSVHVGDIHITCPGVTSKEVAKQVGVELNHMFTGLHLDADQQSRIR